MKVLNMAIVLAVAAQAAGQLATGAGEGASGGHVKVFSGSTATASFLAYPGFDGGVRVALGDVDGDGRPDIVTGVGPGSTGGHVKVFSGRTGALIRSFFAYTGAPIDVFVAAGDVNGDGLADIITGAGTGAPSHVKVFSGATGVELHSFFAYSPSFTGGVRVAAGDVNGDGFCDIVTAAGPGAGPHVKAFNGISGAEIASFFAYSANFNGGVFVAAGDLNGDGLAEIVTGPDSGMPTLINKFNGSGAVLGSFEAFPGFNGGVRVAVGDVNGDGRSDIVAAMGGPGIANEKTFDGMSHVNTGNFSPYGVPIAGGVYVGGAPNATLWVKSLSPASGIPITVWKPDLNSRTNGVTTFFRIYSPGFTTSLTAPLLVGGETRAFDHWKKDGVQQGTLRTIHVRMDTSHTLTAVYVPTHALSFQSLGAASVPIVVYQADLHNLKNGTTSFNRLYPFGKVVSMTAPATADGNYFLRWEKNGVPTGSSRTVSVTVSGALTMRAVYVVGRILIVQSSGTTAGVPITVYRRDLLGAQNGTTGFERVYEDGTIASCNAPATAEGKAFSHWKLDGVQQGNARTISVTMGATHTIQAVYN